MYKSFALAATLAAASAIELTSQAEAGWEELNWGSISPQAGGSYTPCDADADCDSGLCQNTYRGQGGKWCEPENFWRSTFPVNDPAYTMSDLPEGTRNWELPQVHIGFNMTQCYFQTFGATHNKWLAIEPVEEADYWRFKDAVAVDPILSDTLTRQHNRPKYEINRKDTFGISENSFLQLLPGLYRIANAKFVGDDTCGRNYLAAPRGCGLESNEIVTVKEGDDENMAGTFWKVIQTQGAGGAPKAYAFFSASRLYEKCEEIWLGVELYNKYPVVYKPKGVRTDLKSLNLRNHNNKKDQATGKHVSANSKAAVSLWRDSKWHKFYTDGSW